MDHGKAAYERAEGTRWIDALEPELAELPKGTVVVVNVSTGEYETGMTQWAALDAFHNRFGNETIGWVHEIGGEIFVGGGIV